MGRRGRQIWVCVVIAVLVMVAAGCGSSSSTDSTSASAQTGASKEFLRPKSKNTAARFGEEGSPEDLAEINLIVERSLEARGNKEWAAQCATLSAATQKRIAGETTCAHEVESEGERAPAGVIVNDLDGEVSAVRVKGDKGYALYHGTDHKDWAMPVEKEDGEWKVAALLGEELGRFNPGQ